MVNSPLTDHPTYRKTAAVLDRVARDMPRLGIALSGGGDSMALLHLARQWAGETGKGRRVLMAATVDHGLRAESAAEARFAARAATALGIPHDTLHWHRKGGGNLMAAARQARLQLLADWARRHDLSAVLLGHTLDDQAETVLMRLGRGAGVDGLSGMSGARHAMGLVWLRPLLAVSRDDLRDMLRGQGIGWIDDPSNQNADYERVRIRQALASLGLPAAQLAQTAANLAMARDALQDAAARIAQDAQAKAGALSLPMDRFAAAPPEIRRRLLVAGLRWINGAPYPARRESVLHALKLLLAGKRATLDGCIVQERGRVLELLREPAAARAAPDATGAVAEWDGRWHISGLAPGQHVQALGYDVLPALNWRDCGLGRDQAASTPGIWSGADLVAAPVLHPCAEITANPLRGVEEFRALLYTH